MRDPMDRCLLDFNSGFHLSKEQQAFLIIEVKALRKRVQQLEGVIHEMGAPFPEELLEQLSKTL